MIGKRTTNTHKARAIRFEWAEQPEPSEDTKDALQKMHKVEGAVKRSLSVPVWLIGDRYSSHHDCVGVDE